MKFKSQVLTQASGSIGGITYSHNKGGLYQRARTIPTDPATAPQVQMRNFVSQLVVRWTAVLTQVQRDAWAVYAANVPVIDALGDAMFISGLNWYVKMNTIRKLAPEAGVDNAPTTFTMAALTEPIFTVASATDLASVAFVNTDSWATGVLGSLLCFFSRPQSAGINFFKGPYRFAASIPGAVIPPTSPQNIGLSFPCAAGNKIFAKFVATDLDGRVSASLRSSAIAA